MPKTQAEIENERAQSKIEENRSALDKSRFENAWAVDPNSVQSQTLLSQSGNEQAEANQQLEKLKNDEAARLGLMQKSPPLDASGAEVSSELDAETPTPFRKKPL